MRTGSALRLACPHPLPFTECYAYTPFDVQSNALGGKVSVDYRFEDRTLAYASVSRGFKAGGVSVGPLDYAARGGSSVVPEHLLTYELGLKAQWLDNTLRANSAIFLNDWRNQQLFLPLNTPGTGLNPVYTNVPHTQSYGLEEELEWAVTAHWYVKTSVGTLGALASGLRWRGAQADSQQPNFVFILADDLGYADLSVYGHTDYRTPHLDELAAQGVRLTQAYANSAVCSATRFALITGRYQYRLRGGLEEPIAGASDTIGLPPTHPTLPSLLRAAGYHTALIGKWHLGSLPKFGPLKSGYEQFFGNYGGDVDYFTHRPEAGEREPEDLYEGEVPVHKAGYYTTLLGDRTVEYIERAPPAVPFFLSLHFTAPHWPWEGPDDEAVSRELKDIFDYDGGNLAVYGRMVAALDEQVGRVLRALDARELTDNTVVVFTSDNGGERFSKMWPFSGQKTELLEGGIRVPAIIRWPHELTPGSVCTQVAISMDWLPTLLAAIGRAPDPAYPSDGVNLLPVLRGEVAPFARTLFWRYKANHQRAVRSADWKYLEINGNEFLFDVNVDQRERANLAQKHPEVLKELRHRWKEWDKQMLPIVRSSFSHSVTPKHQADHFRPED